MSTRESWSFRSPIMKLVRFFCRSRDNWKAKCKEAKRENKSLKYRLAKMTESRNRWKAEARAVAQNAAMATGPVEQEATKNGSERPCRGSRSRQAGLRVVAAR
jgi:hypothetical protein